MTEAELIERYREMRAMGLPKPPDAPEDLWSQAGPYDIFSAEQAIKTSLEAQIIEQASKPLPPGKGSMEALVPLATKVHADVMLDPSAKAGDKLTAARTALEYAYGKPTQAIEHSGSLAIEVHNTLEKLVRDMKSGTVIDTANLLVKERTPVDNFLEKHMPEKFVVGRKASPGVETEKQPRAGFPEGTGEGEGL